MNTYLRLFFSTQGVINRRSFWHGLIVITVINTLLFVAGTIWVGPDSSAKHGSMSVKPSSLWLVYLSVYFTLWPTACVFIKRLRGVGAPVWLAVLSRGLVAIGLASFAISAWMSTRPDAEAALTRAEIAVVLGLFTLLIGYVFDLVLILWLGIFSKTRQPNVAEVFG